MLEKIKSLEKQALRLEPDHDTRAHLNQHVIQYADQFLSNMDDFKTFVLSKENALGLLDFPLQEEGRDIEKLINIVAEHVDHAGLNPASGGHLAYIPGGGVYPTALGDYLADVFNRYAGIFFASPGAVRMENMLIRWMNQMVGFPETALGNLTSGGSIANLIAIVTARDAKEVKARQIPDSVIYLTSQVHHSIQKAIRIAGLNEAVLRYIPVDKQFKMDAQVLQQTIAEDQAKGLNPFLVVASAGTTDTGAIDPLVVISDIAKAANMWFHVDAAYGGFFMLADEVKADFKGIELADSVTIDPHKGLFLAYGTGAVLIKDVAALEKTHVYHANYMQDVVQELSEPSPANLSPELTKHFRGMRMWLPLQLFGVASFRAALSEKIWLTRYFYEEIQKLGFEVGPYPELSVMIYRYVPDHLDANEFNEKIIEMVQIDGRVFLSSTTLDGVFWLRLAVLSFRSHLKTIHTCLGVLKESVDQLLKEG